MEEGQKALSRPSPATNSHHMGTRRALVRHDSQCLRSINQHLCRRFPGEFDLDSAHVHPICLGPLRRVKYHWPTVTASTNGRFSQLHPIVEKLGGAWANGEGTCCNQIQPQVGFNCDSSTNSLPVSLFLSATRTTTICSEHPLRLRIPATGPGNKRVVLPNTLITTSTSPSTLRPFDTLCPATYTLRLRCALFARLVALCEIFTTHESNELRLRSRSHYILGLFEQTPIFTLTLPPSFILTTFKLAQHVANDFASC